jgi:hypothetical protein
MPSPFIGMDPYIESSKLWPDFHSDLAAEIRTQLNQQIQPNYFARLIPYVSYEVIEIGAKQGVYPDVTVWQTQPPSGQPLSPTAVIPPAPVESTVAIETPLFLHSVEIRTIEAETLVTVIEILSPANKRPGSASYQTYQRKRQDILHSSVHLLEIDLLRAGERPPLARPVPVAPYYVVLSRANRRPRVEVWPIQLAEKLPILPIPLLESDPDAPLDLGAAVASVYERGAYASQIDYSQPVPLPELSAEEKVWLNQILGQQQ